MQYEVASRGVNFLSEPLYDPSKLLQILENVHSAEALDWSSVFLTNMPMWTLNRETWDLFGNIFVNNVDLLEINHLPAVEQVSKSSVAIKVLSH